jgi:uncharacterized C2H2 Zn-finger protein
MIVCYPIETIYCLLWKKWGVNMQEYFMKCPNCDKTALYVQEDVIGHYTTLRYNVYDVFCKFCNSHHEIKIERPDYQTRLKKLQEKYNVSTI